MKSQEPKVIFSIAMPESLLKRVEKVANEEGSSRCTIIRRSVLAYLRKVEAEEIKP